jgi:phenylacetic acid degradation operon negative regulatory protein
VTAHRSLILDVYGAYARPLSGWLAVADLVRLMGDLGQDHAAVRSAASRMKKAGLLAAASCDGAAGYSLTPLALDLLRDGDARIFASTRVADRDPDAIEWVLAVFSVPEHRRERRHQLRSVLGRLGFGQLAPGVWLAPARARLDAERALARAELTQYVTLFEGAIAGFDPAPDLVARTWDLEALAGRHVAFWAEHASPLATWRRRRQPADRDAFVAYTSALADWRRLVYLDPGLPPALLPPRWPGGRSRRLFDTIAAELQTPASRHVAAVVARRPAA